MRHITLSSHASDQAEAAAAKRRANFEAESARHEEALHRRRSKADELRRKSQAAFAQRDWLAWTLSFFPRVIHAFKGKPSAPRLAEASRDEVVWNAGSDGEQKVADVLAGQLSDDWVLISGYRNPGGEVDQLLVGPAGVLAMEIKFVNGRVFCNGDRWWRDKYDRYGNLVEQALPIADKKGRGPSAQVNAAADRLQNFLVSRSALQRVSRAVIFSHDSSELGRLEDLTVDLVATVKQLNRELITESITDASIDVQRVVDLIRKDHAFHSKPRNQEPDRRPAHPSRSRPSV